MVASEQGSPVSGYLEAAGRTEGQRYHLRPEEAVWLMRHCTMLSGLRLHLMRELQSALPRAEESTAVTDLKELLSNLIIMGTRLADRDESVMELLERLPEDGVLDSLAVDSPVLEDGIRAIVEASKHLHTVAGATE